MGWVYCFGGVCLPTTGECETPTDLGIISAPAELLVHCPPEKLTQGIWGHVFTWGWTDSVLVSPCAMGFCTGSAALLPVLSKYLQAEGDQESEISLVAPTSHDKQAQKIRKTLPQPWVLFQTPFSHHFSEGIVEDLSNEGYCNTLPKLS